MTKRVWAVALATLIATSACDPSSWPTASWPDIAHCGQQQTSNLFETAVAILLDQGQEGETLTEQSQRELERLAIDHGPELVACVVQSAVAS